MAATISNCDFTHGPQGTSPNGAEALAELLELCPDLRDLLLSSERLSGFLNAVFTGSPFIKSLGLKYPKNLHQILAQPPGKIMSSLVSETRECWRTSSSQQELMASLRMFKSKAALFIALCDFSGLWNAKLVTFWLSEFADASLNASVDYLLKSASEAGKLTLVDSEAPGIGSGYFIFGMGKYGAHELNYSSDIDLIVFYEPSVVQCSDGVEAPVFFTRMTRQLVSIMQDITGHGYVFRMDLRLRPDPRSTPPVISVDAAANYYESMGQNWERAALIKARAVGGDIACGEAFIKELQPFIFRRHLDFAAIADVQSLKRQIHAHKGHGEIAVAGHNIKLGRGGIREIEFFVQTQQLIAGGRAPALRERRTVEMLEALQKSGWISVEVAEDLTESYWFLRGIEHRLQMQNDAQTHTLPESADELFAFAAYAGYASVEAFADDLLMHMRRVQIYYEGLFEGAGELSGEDGSLSFTGAADDPDTLQTLSQMGFKQPGEVSAIIRGWHHGRFAATRSERARELLTELMPDILKSLGNSADADAAFVTFDSFLKGAPAGVQLFSLLKANRKLLDLFALIMGTAPRLAETLAKRPRTLDAMLDPGFFGDLPSGDELALLVSDTLNPASQLEVALDFARAVGQEQMFRIGVRFLTATANPRQVGEAYSALADVLIDALLKAVRADICEKHGDIPGSQFVVLALGKLGGREMTAASDLDLMTIYNVPDDAGFSDGPKPLSAAQYFGRVTQRLIAALSVPTSEGLLYEVDMRLRPSGNKGPISVSLPGFESYHEQSAWTWERMALSRARVTAGNTQLKESVEVQIKDVLSRKRDAEELRNDIIQMRQRMSEELYSGNPWDLKQCPGGLVDVEFIVQYLQLRHANTDLNILRQNAGEALNALANAGYLGGQECRVLSDAYDHYQTLTQLLRLCSTGSFDPGKAAGDLLRLMVSASGEPDFERLEAKLQDTKQAVREIFCELIGVPDSAG